jgi:glycosyltransferase involved in cell wall biosynthesis
MSAANVSVVVPVLNEEVNIARCLGGLEGFAEVIVVDSGSTDATTAIARALGATVVAFRWDGKFPKKRNWMLANFAFRTDWVLFLDADEQVTAAFRRELERVLPATPHAGFWVSYDNFFMGQRLRFGVPQRKLALFRKELGRFETIDESAWSELDMEVHEHPIIMGSVGAMKSRLIHRDYKSLTHFIRRHGDYSDWEARRFLALRRGGAASAPMTARQKIKYSLLPKLWFALGYFAFAYVVRLGFLDGRGGLHYAAVKAIYFYQIALKVRELRAAAASRTN